MKKQKPICTTYLKTISDFEDAVWEYVKHLYPPLSNKYLKVSYFINQSDIDKMQKSRGFKFEATQANKIPVYNKKKVKGVFIFNSKDLRYLFLNYWREQTPSDLRLPSVEAKYRMEIYFCDQLIDDFSTYKKSFTLKKGRPRDIVQEILCRILVDRERCIRTGGTPIEY